MLNAQSFRDTLSAVLTDVSKDDAKSGLVHPYDAEKGSVLLEARMFNETPLNPIKCFDTLTKILNLLVTKGETLTPLEESNLFFGVTKLFQSSNDRLRRMFYLAIKTLTIGEGEAFIVTSSLTKDMNSGSDVHRANAIRVLSKIVDASMATQIERYLKTAIVDKSPFVASSALVCGMRLLKTCPEVVRRWVNEVTECVRSKNVTVQYHALALLYELKKGDRLALHKVVATLTTSPLKSPLAECLLIRYASRILRTERDPTLEKTITEYFEARLRHRSDMIVLEAARAMCQLAADTSRQTGKSINSQDLSSTLTALQIMLSSQRPTVRFASIRTLNQLAQACPQAVSQCNPEIESLLTDTNRSIATLALTALLKTGNESGVERLVKQISMLMADIADSFRIDIIRAVRQLASTYPTKHRVMLTFLASQLREEASFDVKKDLVDSLAVLIHDIPQALETGLLHLCEFIEDCEYPTLCTKVLSLLGELAPNTSCPSKFIRFIYNRLILENAAVRAAAVHALTQVGYRCEYLRRDVSTLLESCLVDNDDEIRERTRLYFKALNPTLQDEDDIQSISTNGTLTLDDVLTPTLPVSLDALIDFSQQWLHSAEGTNSVIPFDLSDLPSEEEYRRLQKMEADRQLIANPIKTHGDMTNVLFPTLYDTQQVTDHPLTHVDLNSELHHMASILCPEDTIGQLGHSCKPIYLTEKEAEYSVMCIKHMFLSNYLIFEFQVHNTMPDQILENVEIILSNFNLNMLSIIGSSKIHTLPYDQPLSCYIIFKKIHSLLNSMDEGGLLHMPIDTFQASMTFLVRETNDEFGYNDSYALESVSISIVDYFVPKMLRPGQFKSQWTALGDEGEVSAKLSLNDRSLQSAITGLIELFNLSPCEHSEIINNTKTSHDLLLSGNFTDGSPVLCRGLLVISFEHGCLLKVICRSKYKKISEKLLTIFD